MLRLAEPSGDRSSISWRDRPLQPLQTASQIVGLSTASLYRFAAEGRLTLKRLGGRTMVETEGLLALLDSAEDWTPAPRTKQARGGSSR